MFFETIKCEDEIPYNLFYHQQRIARTIGLNINLQDYIYPPSNKLLKCKVIYDKNGISTILYSNYTPKEIKTFKLVYNNNISYSYKSTNRKSIENLFTTKGKADDIIIVKNDFITDTSIANIAIFYGNHWITPRLPLLKGTYRAKLLDNNFLIEKDITVDMLKNAKQIALLNAMIEFKVIKNFDII